MKRIVAVVALVVVALSMVGCRVDVAGSDHRDERDRNRERDRGRDHDREHERDRAPDHDTY